MGDTQRAEQESAGEGAPMNPMPNPRGSSAHFYAQIPEVLLDPRTTMMAEVAVYGWLDRRAGARGWWHSSQRELAREIGLDERSVRRAVESLSARGLVVISASSYRQRCFQLVARIAAPAPQCDHADRGAGAALLRHLRPVSSDRTLLDRKSPQKSPYTRARGKAAERSGPDLYARVVQRVWPPDEQGALPL
jgi:hypothetical protein